MSRCIRLLVAFDGSGYQGWQRQAHGPTVQGELERGLATLCGHPSKEAQDTIERVKGLDGDRFLAPDLAAAEKLVRDGVLAAAAEKKVGVLAV